jgi:hypothetical protein
MSHEAMYPPPPVTHTRRGTGGDAISAANHRVRPACCSRRALMASLRCANRLMSLSVFVLRKHLSRKRLPI